MIGFFILLFVFVIVVLSIRPSEVVARWQHYFDEFQFSSEEFYRALEEGIKRREIPDAMVGRANYFEGSLVSQKRAYFKVNNVDYIFDICAAPYGKSFFVSWWLKESKSFGQLFLERYFPFANQKTYYQLDTESMFRESIHKIVLEVIDSMTSGRGTRGPSELERQIITNPKYAFKA